MGAKLEEETVKIHIRIYKDDLELLDSLFCRSGQRAIGRSKAIRNIIRSYLKTVQANTDAKPVKFDPALAESFGVE